jgi:pimeloyl-ACP methyl ester carboxylesterase
VEHEITVDGMRIHVLEEGSGEPVLFLHGWPTSSFLWRHAVAAVGGHRRAIAIDLPGFGRSSKPLDSSYSARWYAGVLDGALVELGVERTGLAVHDLGGPIGLWWAVDDPERITDLALLNTLVFPETSLAVKAFVAASFLPGLRSLMVNRRALEWAMRFGVNEKGRITPEIATAYSAPFVEADARRALLKAAHGIHPAALREIAGGLASIEVPVRILYGADDRILPDVARTMKRVVELLPQAELTELAGKGHFVQEDAPDEVAGELARFFARDTAGRG